MENDLRQRQATVGPGTGPRSAHGDVPTLDSVAFDLYGSSAMAAVLGIDLGRASCSAYALLAHGAAEKSFSLCIEPIVALTHSNEWLVGEDARRAAASGGGEAVWDLLVLQGRKLSDHSPAQLETWPFRLVAGAAGKALVEFQLSASLPRKVFAPEELLAVLFARLRQLTEQRAMCDIQDASLTVPASYNYTQRQALRDACAMAGLHAHRVVVSSTAAGLAYTVPRGNEIIGQLLVVVDVGAGSVDVSMVSASHAGCVKVKATAGDAAVGGVVFTERIVDHFLRDSKLHGTDASLKTLNRLRRASQLAKKILTTSEVASVQLQVDTGAFAGTITRAQFDSICCDCWNGITELIQLVLAEGHATADQINSVVLCGGSVVLPAVRNVVQQLFPATEVDVDNTGELQARGAALLAASLVGTSGLAALLDVTPLAFGVQRYSSKDPTILIPANTRVPASGDNVFFVGGHVSDLAYRVLEGRRLRHGSLTSTNKSVSTAPHCVGTIRALRAPLTLTTTAKPVVTKLTIAFDLSDDLQLTASITDLTTKQLTSTTFIGNDSVLPRDSIVRTMAELDRIFGGHRRATMASSASKRSALVNGTVNTDAVLEYAQTLRGMVASKTLAVRISDDDGRRLTSKLDELQTWLHSSTSSSQPPQKLANGGDNHTDTTRARSAADEPVRTHLRALRRLHWTIVAAAAIAQLRDEADA